MVSTTVRTLEIPSYQEGYDFPWITDLKALEGYQIWLQYSDGIEGVVDVSEWADKPLFAEWQEPGLFEQVRIGNAGEIWWTDRASFCPDSFYLKLTGKSFDEVTTYSPQLCK